MMTLGKHRIKRHMSMEYNFSGIRILSGNLIPVDWHLSVDIVALDKKGQSTEESEFNATVSYQRLYFWLETNLPHVVVVDVSNRDDLYLANLSSNIMLYSYDDPYDDNIAQLLHAKLTSLADGDLRIGEIRLKGSDVSIQYSFHPDGGYDLPMTTDEYYTEGETIHSIPWWGRNDGFCSEFVKLDENSANIVDPMIEFDKFIKDAAENSVGIVREPARIVKVEKWQPRKV